MISSFAKNRPPLLSYILMDHLLYVCRLLIRWLEVHIARLCYGTHIICDTDTPSSIDLIDVFVVI